MEFTNSDLLIKLLGIFISFFGVIVPLYKFITEKKFKPERFKIQNLSSINKTTSRTRRRKRPYYVR